MQYYHLSRCLKTFDKDQLIKHFAEILKFTEFYDNNLDFYLAIGKKEKSYYQLNNIPLQPNGIAVNLCQKPYKIGKKLNLSDSQINRDMLIFAILEIIYTINEK